VFASADQDNLQKTIDAGTVTPPPVVFAKNRLQIAVEKGNPKKIKSLSDLQKSGLVVVLCADQVPCGKYAAQSLAMAGVTINPSSKEENAKATLSKVSIGEADASIVYVTDVKASKGTTSGVKIPDKVNVIATYPIGVVKASQNATAAKAWVKYVSSKEGQTTLRKFGFLPP
jgi:molybdate transport system substrate-binding protein